MEMFFISEYFSIELFSVNAIFNLVCLNDLVTTFVSFTTYVNVTCFVVSFFLPWLLILFYQIRCCEGVWIIVENIFTYWNFFIFCVFWNTLSVYFCSGGWQELAGVIVSVVVGFLYMLNFSASVFLDIGTFILWFSSCSYENNNFCNNVESSMLFLYERRFVIDYENIIYVFKIDTEIFTTFCTAVIYKTLWRTRAFRE